MCKISAHPLITVILRCGAVMTQTHGAASRALEANTLHSYATQEVKNKPTGNIIRPFMFSLPCMSVSVSLAHA